MSTPRDCFTAYVTTQGVDNPRTPIVGERIVIVLGEDKEGDPLELSIELTKQQNDPGKLVIHSIVEPVSDIRRQRKRPRLNIELSPAVNVFRISLEASAPPDALN